MKIQALALSVWQFVLLWHFVSANVKKWKFSLVVLSFCINKEVLHLAPSRFYMEVEPFHLVVQTREKYAWLLWSVGVSFFVPAFV